MAKRSVVKKHELDVRTIEFWAVGVTPLLVHRFSGEAIEAIASKQAQDGQVSPKGARDPHEEYMAAFYVMDDGNYGIPTMAFKRAAVEACTSANLTKTAVRQQLHVIGGSLLRVYYPEGSPPRMQTDRVVVNGEKTTLRYRPCFPEWAVCLRVRYNASPISAEQIVNLFNLAGFGVGVGDWRCQKNGNHGLFEVAGARPDWAKE